MVKKEYYENGVLGLVCSLSEVYQVAEYYTTKVLCSILEPLLFFTYINDLNSAVRYCSVHHFADDRNLLNYNISSHNL